MRTQWAVYLYSRARRSRPISTHTKGPRMTTPTYTPTYPVLHVTTTTPPAAIIDAVEAHLLAQGVAARYGFREGADGPQCVNRNSDGQACAVGCLIPDAWCVVDSSLGIDSTIRTLTHHDDPDARALGEAFLAHAGLLQALQLIHDTAPHTMWPEKFATLRARYAAEAT